TLTRDHHIPFRSAHAIASRLVAARACAEGRALSVLVSEISHDLLGRSLVYSDAALTEILSPKHFVRVRRTRGGPSPEETARAAGIARQQLEADRQWWMATTEALTAAERRLADRSQAL